jgi:hypothetical protein
MANFEIPLLGTTQRLSITLNGINYIFRLRYCFTPMGGWILDIYDQNASPLICGIPLVTGCDLIGQYRYVGIPGSLYCASDGDPQEAPHFDNLGTGSHLYWWTG